jgi:phosphoribosylanthranilate isomerase
MMVKICGITNREDALAAAEAGASALGFNFYPGSPRYVSPDTAQAILEFLSSNILKVGVFVNEPAAHIEALAQRLALDVVQLHGEAAEFPAGLRVWRAVRVTPGFSITELDAIPAEACLLDTPAAAVHGGTGRTFDWSVARGARGRVILAGGLDENNVRSAIEAARPWGVDACSRLEAASGRKDHAKMARFLKAALS